MEVQMAVPTEGPMTVAMSDHVHLSGLRLLLLRGRRGLWQLAQVLDRSQLSDRSVG
ncbi:hypothetical protein [Streptomyces tateyamensis]|uniref:hypothetical protein n=1 Tax=Streptomyces tateyamensis TaxID=565073 RepID=UPI0015E8BD38|nr:hypothetical protein [Streptomyces tateyamensis]